MLSCSNENLAKKICDIIGSKLQLPSESKQPFKCLGPLTEFNGSELRQFRSGVTQSCTKHIQRLLKAHGWNKAASDEDDSKPGEPLPTNCLQQIYAATGPAEGTSAHAKLQKQKGFSCRTLLGEILCACVTCRPDCGYAVVTLSKFASAPAAIHCGRLRALAKYLRRTAHWGITFWRPAPLMTLPEGTPAPTPDDKDLPEFPSPWSPQELAGHVDAAHANDLRNRRSTTGYIFTMAGGAIACRSTTQGITATSSTEAELHAAGRAHARATSEMS